ncbi:hypothetical protein [Pendulispora albinea]|uniref:Uncharacterized protein n=1 Tax=Pendulispora albinea TaxID=2741071 RepID=A0ABZ2LME6_9BACT
MVQALLTRTARADDPAPMTRNDYSIEFYQGPLIAPIRVTGLAGAYTAYAEGVEGTASNASAPAVREPFSHKWFDYDISAGISFPGAFAGSDFDNRGRRGNTGTTQFSDFLYVNLGLQLQFGGLGMAVTSDLQQFKLTPATETDPGLTLQTNRSHIVAAYGFWGNQVSLGLGLRVVALQISQTGQFVPGRTLVSMLGAAPEVGALYKPDGAPFRVGATLRAPVSAGPRGESATTRDNDGVERADKFILPAKIVQPWEAELGVALQAGPRPLNPAWLNPHEQEAPVRDAIAEARTRREREHEAKLAAAPPNRRRELERTIAEQEDAVRRIEDMRLEAESERLLAQRRARYANWPREKILMVASVLFTGPSDDSVDVGSFLDQKKEPFGRNVTVMPRFAIEAEPVHDRVRGRIGAYLEPSRFPEGNARQHLTCGADIKLFPFDAWGLIGATTWRISFAVDLAPRYTNWGVGIGAWH